MLFICIGNSCRSPMAEAMTRQLGGPGVDARSAGLAPAGWVAERTIQTLDRLGYDSEDLHSKGIDDVDTDDVDIVVSLLGDEMPDLLPRCGGARREQWPVYDPFGEDEATYLEVARQIESRVRRLLDEELEAELL